MYVYLIKIEMLPHIYCHSVPLAQLPVNDVHIFFAYLFPWRHPKFKFRSHAHTHTHAATLLTLRGEKYGWVSCNRVSSWWQPLSSLPSSLNITDHSLTTRHYYCCTTQFLLTVRTIILCDEPTLPITLSTRA